MSYTSYTTNVYKFLILNPLGYNQDNSAKVTKTKRNRSTNSNNRSLVRLSSTKDIDKLYSSKKFGSSFASIATIESISSIDDARLAQSVIFSLPATSTKELKSLISKGICDAQSKQLNDIYFAIQYVDITQDVKSHLQDMLDEMYGKFKSGTDYRALTKGEWQDFCKKISKVLDDYTKENKIPHTEAIQILEVAGIK